MQLKNYSQEQVDFLQNLVTEQQKTIQTQAASLSRLVKMLASEDDGEIEEAIGEAQYLSARKSN